MPTNERIEKLLKELEIEVTIGMLHKGVDENLRFQFIVPVSKSIKNGVVLCQFSARPIHRDSSIGQSIIDAPRLRVVDSNQSLIEIKNQVREEDAKDEQSKEY